MLKEISLVKHSPFCFHGSIGGNENKLASVYLNLLGKIVG